VKTLIVDGALIGLGLVVADFFPLRDQLGILLLLIAALVIAYLFWRNRP
jgi:hypothetical protein